MIPTVSVILPTYNRAHCLRRCILSVLGQTYRDFELLVIDDASTDDTAGLMKEFDDPRIRYHRFDTNQRQCRARNWGIQNARGRYIAFQDSDDVWLPERLEKQVAFLDGQPADVGLVYGISLCVGPRAASQVLPPLPRMGEAVEAPDFARNIAVPFLMQSWLVRREVFEKVGDFDPAFHVADDWDLAARISQAYRIAALPEPCCVVIQTEGSLTSDSTRFTPEVAAYISERYCRYYGNGRAQQGHIAFIMAVLNLRSGNFDWGRREMWRALKLAPTQASAWAHALLSVAGRQRYRETYMALQRRRGWLF
ncbi:MAG TPA: glycosyltransferase family 2 protein [Solimonas sp.]|nr:glycosyltransferase family 2 protein [Solimonas sp.]